MAYYVIVEGDGDQRAVPNLLTRWSQAIGGHSHFWRPPIRVNVQRERDARHVVDLVSARKDADGLLVLRDDEDGCPKQDGPQIAEWFKALDPPFPVACVLLYREYETLFLPFVSEWAGRPLSNGRVGLREDARFSGDPEGPRDAKGILTKNMASGRAYKETIDQLEFTRLLDISSLRSSGLPCAETFDRALGFLLGPGQAGEVFPIDR